MPSSSMLCSAAFQQAWGTCQAELDDALQNNDVVGQCNPNKPLSALAQIRCLVVLFACCLLERSLITAKDNACITHLLRLPYADP